MPNKSKYFWDNPPRCIAGFQVKPTSIAGVPLDGHFGVENITPFRSFVFAVKRRFGTTSLNLPERLNTAFSLRCRCGHQKAHILGHYVRPEGYDPVVFVGPLALQCESCGATTELIDTDIHGYDAELGHGSCTVRGQGRRVAFACDICGPAPMDVVVRFEYSGDLSRDAFSVFRGREQDLFSWFTALGRCSGCSHVMTAADFECS